MNWAKTLRRWTMRSIHAAILGSALFGSAGAAFAQTGAAPGGQSSAIHYTRSQSFDLPVQMKQEDRQTLSEIRLYVKTPGAGWKLQERGTPDLTRFSCKIAQDGEYWYTLALVDRGGRMTPADVTVEPPSQRVIVDTTAPLIQVQAQNSNGDLCIRCTAQDANPDHASLKAVCRTRVGDIPLEIVPNQPGVFRLKGAEMMQFPIVVSMRDQAGNIGTKEVNVREMVGISLAPTGTNSNASPPSGGTEPTRFVPPPPRSDMLPPPRSDVLPPPRSDVLPPPRSDVLPPPKYDGAGGPITKVEFPPPPSPIQPNNQSAITNPGLTETPGKLPETTPLKSSPHQLINTTHATVEYRIDQVGPSGVGKVEIYMTPDKGQTWHRLSEDVAKRSPANISLPGDGLYGIRIVVANGNGFGGKAPVRGDAPHCMIEVDTTSPFVQIRSTDILPNTGHVEIRWNTTDKNLGSEPVSLYYRTRPDGPWQVIAKGVKNDGVHRWAFPRDSGGHFFFKVEVTDQASNVSHDVSRQPIVIDMSEPRATVVGISGSGAAPR